MAVEERFGVGFEDIAFQTCITLGDFHAVLLEKLGNIEGIGGQCASQMAFYRLRRAAGPTNEKAKPETPLDALCLGNPRTTMYALQRIGLRTPNASFGILGSIMIPVGLLAGLGFTISAFKGFALATAVSAVVLTLSIIIGILAPRSYPEGVTTLGDLAIAVARRNPMMLKAHGAGLRPGAVWESLCDLSAEHAGISPNEIFPDTPLYQRKMKDAVA